MGWFAVYNGIISNHPMGSIFNHPNLFLRKAYIIYQSTLVEVVITSANDELTFCFPFDFRLDTKISFDSVLVLSMTQLSHAKK